MQSIQSLKMSFLKWKTLCRTTKRCFSNRNILTLKDRGVIQEIFPNQADEEIVLQLNKPNQYVYAGFDPTADSLHIGNLLILINLLHWQRSGHTPIAMLGGATGRIGDPSGRKTDRIPLKEKEIQVNVKGITNNIKNIFENHEKYYWEEHGDTLKPLIILNNEDWYDKMSAIDFVSKLGRNFRMGTMLLKQSVQTRINSSHGMSFTEFSYQMFQAYDWLCLYKKYKCAFQVGGSDQMGNILAGHDLISKVEKEKVYGLTLPIITTKEGDKLGKSAGNAIWLDSKKTSPFDFYQYFYRLKDSEVEFMLKSLTFLPLNTITDLMVKHFTEPEKRLAQKTLAGFLTKLVHGEEGLQKALTTTDILFSRNIKSLLNLDKKEMCEVFKNAHSVDVLLTPGMTVVEMAMAAKCFPRIDDAIRIIQAGGFTVNHQKVLNCEEVLTKSVHILPNKLSLLGVGKRNFYIVKWLEVNKTMHKFN